MTGLLVIDKPAGMTSRDAVNYVERTLPRGTKVGHTGTLDPLATGVLVICVGQATRLADDVQAMGKGYTATVRLGATSTSDDADGEVTETPDALVPTRNAVEAACLKLIGVVEQLPPQVSALKIDGRRAHDLARKGVAVPVQPRTVHVQSIAVTGYEWPHVTLAVECGKGTYVRSIARDLGAALGCGGYVTALRRTHVGPFAAGQGVSVDASLATLTASLRPMAEGVCDLATVRVSESEAKALFQGQTLATALVGRVAVFVGDTLHALAEADGSRLRPRAVFPVAK